MLVYIAQIISCYIVNDMIHTYVRYKQINNILNIINIINKINNILNIINHKYHTCNIFLIVLKEYTVWAYR